MLFEEDAPPQLVKSLRSLETANAELGVPWPYDEQDDTALLTRIKAKYPLLDIADLVDDFLIWCSDARPWEDKKGKEVVIRWRSRLWTRARNEIEYKKKPKKQSRTSTHYVATERNEKNQILDEW